MSVEFKDGTIYLNDMYMPCKNSEKITGIIIVKKMETKDIKSRVKKLLKENKDFRDNNEALAVNLWGEMMEEQGLDTNSILTVDFLAFISSGKLPKFDSITRISRMIQMEDPENYGGTRRLNKLKQQKAKRDMGYEGN